MLISSTKNGKNDKEPHFPFKFSFFVRVLRGIDKKKVITVDAHRTPMDNASQLYRVATVPKCFHNTSYTLHVFKAN